MLQPAGQVVVHSVPGDVKAAKSTWSDIPAMRGAITLPKGGTLVANLTMEVATLYTGSGNPDLIVRMVVDDKPVLGSDIRFCAGVSAYRTIGRDYTAGSLSPGPHRVRFQWISRPGTAYTLGRNRTLVLRFATKDAPEMRLTALQNVSVVSTTAKGWTNFQTLKTTMGLPWDADMIFRYSGDAFSNTSRVAVAVRALLDGKVVSDAVVTKARAGGSQAFVFIKNAVPKGTHTVQMQWYMSKGGTIYRPMTIVEAYRKGGGRTVALSVNGVESAAIKKSSSTFSAIPTIGYAAIGPKTKGDLEVRLSMEAAVLASSRMILRCVVDGKTIGKTIDLTEWKSDPYREWGTNTATWVVRNLEPGIHAVRVDWAAAAGTVYLGDRSLVVTQLQGQAPLLVTALESTRPTGYKYGGTYASSVVQIKNSQRVFRSYVGDMFWRAQPGVADWFYENSAGGLYVVEAGIVGPKLKKYDEKTYRGLANPFTKMKIEALQKADATFDYSYYDRNGDRKITTDELYPLVVMYQDTNFGEVRNNVNNVATSDGVTLDFSGGLATVYTPDFKKRWEIGVADHELSHLIIHAGDMYESNDPTAPGPYSIMDQHTWNGHLDPLHKWKAGKFYEPEIAYKDGYVTLGPIASDPRFLMLRNPKSHNGEFFLVENRGGASYNASLPSQGLALWHCDQKRLPNWRTAIEIEPAGGLTNKFRYNTYLFRGTDLGFAVNKDVWDDSLLANTRWHDKTRSGIGLWAIERIWGTKNMRFFVDVPGPGALVQWQSRRVDIGPGGKFRTYVRVVNTDYSSDTMTVTLSSAAKLSWRSKTFSIKPYERKILAVDVTPTAFPQPVTASVSGTRGGSSKDTMNLVGSCRSILTVAPKKLPNLTMGYFDVQLNNSVTVIDSVTLGGKVIRSQDANDWSDGYYQLLNSGKLVRVHPPQGMIPGSYPLRVRFPLCSTNSVNVSLTRMSSLSLLTTPVLTAGRTQGLWTSKGNLHSGSVAILTISGSPKQSVIPKIVKLDLGDSFRSFYMIPAVVVNPLSNTIGWFLPTPGAIANNRIYFQTILIDPTNISQFLTTNRVQTDYR